MLRAGRLNKRITIEQRVRTPQAPAGDRATAFTTNFSCWAEILPLSGKELIAAQAVQNTATHRITIRYRSDKTLTAGMRVRYQQRYFNITAVPRSTAELHEDWVFEAEEGLKSG